MNQETERAPDCREVARLVIEVEIGRLEREFAAVRSECLVSGEDGEIEPSASSGIINALGWLAVVVILGLWALQSDFSAWIVAPLAVTGLGIAGRCAQKDQDKYNRLTEARSSFEYSRSACCEVLRLLE